MKQEFGNFSSLNKNQKTAAVLLSTGTFLEYFDLMRVRHEVAARSCFDRNGYLYKTTYMAQC